jgi:hypothetical protein
MRAGAGTVLQQQHLSFKLQPRQLQQASAWQLQLVLSTVADAGQLPCMLVDPRLQKWQLAAWDAIPLRACRIVAAATTADADAACDNGSSGCKVLADQGALGQPVLRWHTVAWHGMLQHPGQ